MRWSVRAAAVVIDRSSAGPAGQGRGLLHLQRLPLDSPGHPATAAAPALGSAPRLDGGRAGYDAVDSRRTTGDLAVPGYAIRPQLAALLNRRRAVAGEKKRPRTDRGRRVSQGGLGADGWQESAPWHPERCGSDFVAHYFSAALRTHPPARVLLDEYVGIEVGDPLLALEKPAPTARDLKVRLLGATAPGTFDRRASSVRLGPRIPGLA
jgi:hypothetical protein